MATPPTVVVPFILAQDLPSEPAALVKVRAGTTSAENDESDAVLIDDALRGLADIEAGRIVGADAAIAEFERRRKASSTGEAAKMHG